MLRAALPALAIMLCLGGCSSGDDPGAGGLTPEEARQLNEAAAATDINATANVVDGAE